MIVTTSRSGNHCSNSHVCCAERCMIKQLKYQALKEGVSHKNFSRWIHRIHGTFIIERSNGFMGSTIPCVLCRKMMDGYRIQWSAFTGKQWVCSNEDSVPDSRPTNRQRTLLFK